MNFSRDRVFAHGQCFVAFSRVKNRESLCFLGNTKDLRFTNVVMQELLEEEHL